MTPSVQVGELRARDPAREVPCPPWTSASKTAPRSSAAPPPGWASRSPRRWRPRARTSPCSRAGATCSSRRPSGSARSRCAATCTNPADLKRLVDRTLKAFGGIDILVNNGGGPPRGALADATDEAIERAVELLLLSAVRLTNLCLRHLEKSGRGRVINIESSSVREPVDNLALSNIVRPGVIGWAKTLAREAGPKKITVNTIAPGKIDTPRLAELYVNRSRADDMKAIPLRRFGDAREIADVVCFLASDRASYVTGTVIPVDGGLTRGLL